MTDQSIGYQVDRVGDDVVRIRLGAPEAWPDSVSRAVCVYAIDGEQPALINAGHPVQQTALKTGLESAGIEPETISRIIYNAWSIELLGGAAAWPDVDHFVWSEDMVQPTRYRRRVDEEREAFLSFGRTLLSEGPFEDYELGQVEAFASSFWPEVPERLEMIPVSNGHRVRASDWRLEVSAAPGPADGHVAFWEESEGHLFPGHIVHRGMPERMTEVQSYIVSLERLIDLDPEMLWPVRGDRRDNATWALTGAHRFINNFMSNAPSALFKSPTLPEFMERDWGFRPENAAEVVWRGRMYHSLLEELVRADVIEAEGDGIGRRYGTDVDDPREQARWQGS